MTMRTACICGCCSTANVAVHAIAAVLADDDIDRALEAGLLTVDSCPACSPECTATLLAARDARLTALAARERFRSRAARLQQRQHERSLRRVGPVQTIESDTPASKNMPTLPPAAAAALARAKARAAGHE